MSKGDIRKTCSKNCNEICTEYTMIQSEVKIYDTNLANKFSSHITSDPDVQGSSGIGTYYPSVGEGEDSSCLDHADNVIGWERLVTT
jgi:hypothetical protein